MWNSFAHLSFIWYRLSQRDERKGEEIGEVGEEKPGKKSLFKEEKLEKNKNPRTWYYSSREVREWFTIQILADTN